MVPVISSLDLAVPFSASLPSFFEHVCVGEEPIGKYTAYFLFAQVDSLRDGSIDSGDVVATDSIDLFFSP